MKIVWALVGALCVLSMTAFAADAGQIEEGKQVYQDWCWNCHGEGVGKPGTQALAAKYKGSKPAIHDQRTDLTPALTKFFVRKGISIMPPFARWKSPTPNWTLSRLISRETSETKRKLEGMLYAEQQNVTEAVGLKHLTRLLPPTGQGIRLVAWPG
jgi:hypothetical protein